MFVPRQINVYNDFQKMLQLLRPTNFRIKVPPFTDSQGEKEFLR